MRLIKTLLLILITSSLHSQQFLGHELDRANDTFTVSGTTYALDSDAKDILITGARANSIAKPSNIRVDKPDDVDIWFWNEGDNWRFELEDRSDLNYEFGTPDVGWSAWRSMLWFEQDTYSIPFEDGRNVRIIATTNPIWDVIGTNPEILLHHHRGVLADDGRRASYLNSIRQAITASKSSRLEEIGPIMDTVRVRFHGYGSVGTLGNYGRDRLSVPQNSRAVIRLSTSIVANNTIEGTYVHEAAHAFNALALVGGYNNSLVDELWNHPDRATATRGYWMTNKSEFFAEIITTYIGQYHRDYIRNDSFYQNTVLPKLNEWFNGTRTGVRGKYLHKYSGVSSNTLTIDGRHAGHLNSSRVSGNFSSWAIGGRLYIGNDVVTIHNRNSSTIYIRPTLQDTRQGDYIYYEPPN